MPSKSRKKTTKELLAAGKPKQSLISLALDQWMGVNGTSSNKPVWLGRPNGGFYIGWEQ